MRVTRARPVVFCVTDFGKRCNEKEANDEETNFVKRVVKIVKWGDERERAMILGGNAKRLLGN